MTLAKTLFLFLLLCMTQGIYAQSFEAREAIGIQSRWKGMQFTLINNNAFESDATWLRDITRFTWLFSTQKTINFGVGFQYLYSKIEEGTSRENRPLLFLRYQKDLGVFQLRDFNTMEFRFLEGEHIKRYRNQLDLRLRKFERIQPFVMTEAFVNLGPVKHVRQRMTVGARVFVNKLVLNFFSFYEKNKDTPRWTERTAVGVAAIYRLSST